MTIKAGTEITEERNKCVLRKSQHCRITDLNASLPPEVDAPQVDMVVHGSHVRLGRLSDQFTRLQQPLATLLQVTNAFPDLTLTPLAVTARTGWSAT